MSEDEKKLSIGLPGEWAVRKALGPTLDELGGDLQKLYKAGRDKLLEAAVRKVKNADDGKRTNLRVTRDVLWNGAFSEEEVCAEYFGGILAASRSEDGKDDTTISFVDTIKAMSSGQLRLHYVLYRALNMLLPQENPKLNVGLGNDLSKLQIWLASREVEAKFRVRIDTDLNVLHRQGLATAYKYDSHEIDKGLLPYVWIQPTVYGVLLYCVAQNRLDDWRSFASEDFGEFSDLGSPRGRAFTIDKLLDSLGLAPKKQEPEQDVTPNA